MSTISISEQLMNEFRGDTLSRVASALGESPAKLQTALGGVLPALLGGLATKASTGEGSSELLNLIRRNHDTGQDFDAARALASPGGVNSLINTGKPLLDSILGARANSVIDWVASYAGINRSSSASLLSLAAPISLGVIGRQVSPSGLSASSLVSLLGNPKTLLLALPAGLVSALGLSGVADTARYAANRAGHDIETRRASSMWKWALPLLLILLVGYFFIRRSQPPTGRVMAPSRAAGTFVDRLLPAGGTLHVPSNGVESKLLAYINDPAATASRETWFSFDRLEFESDSATLKLSSKEQLGNIANILKAYPGVDVKIGGYTDNIGDEAYNLLLSRERATNTMNSIVSMGVDPNRLAAEGYGEQFPVADNSTEEGRQRNRRIDIRVTKK